MTGRRDCGCGSSEWNTWCCCCCCWCCWNDVASLANSPIKNIPEQNIRPQHSKKQLSTLTDRKSIIKQQLQPLNNINKSNNIINYNKQTYFSVCFLFLLEWGVRFDATTWVFCSKCSSTIGDNGNLLNTGNCLLFHSAAVLLLLLLLLMLLAVAAIWRVPKGCDCDWVARRGSEPPCCWIKPRNLHTFSWLSQ